MPKINLPIMCFAIVATIVASWSLFLAHHAPLLLLVFADPLVAVFESLGLFLVALGFDVLDLVWQDLVLFHHARHRRIEVGIFRGQLCVRCTQRFHSLLDHFEFFRRVAIQHLQLGHLRLPLVILFGHLVGQLWISVKWKIEIKQSDYD